MSPPQEPLTMKWGPALAFVVTGGGALYAIWRKALHPLLVFSVRKLGMAAHKERFMQLDHAVQAVASLGRQNVYTTDQLNRIEEASARTERQLEAHGLALERIVARLDEWDKTR